MKKIYLTIDAGGTWFKSALLDSGGEIMKGSAFCTSSYSEEQAEKITEAYRKTVFNALDYARRKGLKLAGIGVATPGPFDYENGIPLMKHKFSAIYGVNIRNLIYEIPGVPSGIPIRFMQDANAALAGELWKGNALSFANTALVTLGTGLGFAYSQNFDIQYNNQGGPAASIYRLPYREGVLEDYVSKRGFLKIYEVKSGKKDTNNIKVSDIGKWADEGDEVSIATFREVAEILADALYHILNEKDIQCLLLSGQISKSFDHMKDSLQLGLNDLKSLQLISSLRNIDNAPLLGALWNILNFNKLN